MCRPSGRRLRSSARGTEPPGEVEDAHGVGSLGGDLAHELVQARHPGRVGLVPVALAAAVRRPAAVVPATAPAAPSRRRWPSVSTGQSQLVEHEGVDRRITDRREARPRPGSRTSGTSHAPVTSWAMSGRSVSSTCGPGRRASRCSSASVVDHHVEAVGVEAAHAAAQRDVAEHLAVAGGRLAVVRQPDRGEQRRWSRRRSRSAARARRAAPRVVVVASGSGSVAGDSARRCSKAVERAVEVDLLGRVGGRPRHEGQQRDHRHRHRRRPRRGPPPRPTAVPDRLLDEPVARPRRAPASAPSPTSARGSAGASGSSWRNGQEHRPVDQVDAVGPSARASAAAPTASTTRIGPVGNTAARMTEVLISAYSAKPPWYSHGVDCSAGSTTSTAAPPGTARRPRPATVRHGCRSADATPDRRATTAPPRAPHRGAARATRVSVPK